MFDSIKLIPLYSKIKEGNSNRLEIPCFNFSKSSRSQRSGFGPCPLIVFVNRSTFAQVASKFPISTSQSLQGPREVVWTLSSDGVCEWRDGNVVWAETNISVSTVNLSKFPLDRFALSLIKLQNSLF